MDIEDTAGGLKPRGVLGSIASVLAPAGSGVSDFDSSVIAFISSAAEASNAADSENVIDGALEVFQHRRGGLLQLRQLIGA